MDDLGSHRAQAVHDALRGRDRDEDGALGPERERGVGAGEAGVATRRAHQVRVVRPEGGDGALSEVADAAG